MTELRELHLDLEDTIITPVVNGWANTELINLDLIRRVMAQFKPDTLHLFSFAVWNEHELERFNRFVRPMIEHELQLPISSTPTVDDQILPACVREANLHRDTVDFSDMSAFWGKQGAFRLYMRQRHKSTHKHGRSIKAVLLDDAVHNEIFELLDAGVQAAALNIDSPVLEGHLQTFLRRTQ